MSENRKVRIKDVASRAGVANSTVSHVLNGTASISPQVRERVLTAAREMGYLAKREAKANIPVLTSILLAVNNEELLETDANLFSWTILNALSKECKRRGVKLSPYSSPDHLEAEHVVAAAREAKADGIVIVKEDNSTLLNAVRASGIPAVLINGEDQEMQIDSVAPGNRFAAQLATNFLLSKGHCKILHITFDGRATINRRADGFLDAFRYSDQPLENAPIMRVGGYEPRYGEEAIENWLSQNGGLNGVTAVFSASDNLALGAIKALEANGYHVPSDVSVMGFDGVTLGELVKPALTTVKVPLKKIGPAALGLLEQRISHNETDRVAYRLELGCSIIERDSVATLN